MTDKVQKIRAFLVGIADADGVSTILAKAIEKKILPYIDSLQEEPVPKVFEDMFNAKTAAESLGISQEEHDAIVDECLYGKEPELVDVDDLPNKKEEPVSDDLKTELNKYIRGHFTIDTEQLDRFGIEKKDYMYSMDKSDMLALVEHFINWHKTKEEPVSDELEEAMQHNAPNNIGIDDLLYWRNGFIAGAKWQKEQNKQWLDDNHKQIFNNGFEEGFEAGRDDMEEQLKKDAIYGEWFRRGIVLPSEYNADDVKTVKITIWQDGV